MDVMWWVHFLKWPFIYLVIFWAVGLFVWPNYNVWAAHKSGEADLAKAKNEQAIQVAQANSRLAAAEANKAAAIVEAEAVAEQIKIIGDNVKDHPLYLTWQWIEMMKHRDGATIYVPTEANLPILEAGRKLSPLPAEPAPETTKEA